MEKQRQGMMKFSPCQERAFKTLDRFFDDDEKRFCMILGAGGVGKTSSLRHYFQASKAWTFSIHKFAPTHQAKRELQRNLDTGHAAETIAAFFGLTSVVHPSTLKEEYREAGQWKAFDKDNAEVTRLSETDISEIVWRFQPFQLPKHEVLKKAMKAGQVVVMVIDEISMINGGDFWRIVNLHDEFPELKIILLGDHMQLPPVEPTVKLAGSPFFKPDFYKRPDVCKVIMKTVVRQSDPAIAANLGYIRECISKSKAVDFSGMKQNENFQIVNSLLDHITEFDDVSSDIRAIAWRNVTVDDLNNRITDMRHRGKQTETNLQTEFRVGDTVVFKAPYQSENGMRINNGDAFTITSIRTTEKIGPVSKYSLLEFEVLGLDRMTSSGLRVEEPLKIFRFRDPKQYVYAKKRLESQIKREDDLTKRSGMIKKEMRELKESHAFFKMGWASTVHSVQGMSITRVLVDANDIYKQWDVDMRNRLLYTAISRMREKAIIAFQD